MEATDIAENRAAQSDEADVLKSIYGDDCTFLDDHSCEICVLPPEEFNISPLLLRLYFPETYPSNAEPVLEIEAPWLDLELRKRLTGAIQKVYEENAGNVIVFTLVEWMKEQIWLWEHARSWTVVHNESVLEKVVDKPIESGINYHTEGADNVYEGTKNPDLSTPVVKIADELDTKGLEELDKILGIVHGPPFTEKRSTFQAHLASVKSADQVQTVMEALLRNRKIAGATHNIMAYRIHVSDKGTVLQDYDDDGESAAGGRLLHLLQIVDAIDVVVVVSRWFGGILLGPDRFKHINNAARSLLSTCGYIKGAEQSGADKQKLQTKAARQKGKRR
ncbi:hypothetical protein KP509_07G025700 [Ceratopteris richardii]|uniref:RWD domain-containing protein n=1 Tax=Ceratopteris richardii TaxID=49495 RepID=A0A8T2U9H4_CERRI|nr:hypothetical protein KP509_07G025700 [Ceratopteris richardii]KAH7432507.1 hypothetical protein KP509_07G025700 [Ceratopteris richardii]